MNENLNDDEVLKRSASYWNFYEHSLMLRDAAKEIWPLFVRIATQGRIETRYSEYGLHQVFLLTMAVALENLIKSRILWAQTNEKVIYKDLGEFIGYLKKLTKNKEHDLIRLVTKYKIGISETEKELLDRLNPFTKWAGRFRLPIKKEEIVDEMRKNEHGSFSDLDFETINGLYNKMALEMKVNNI